MEAGFRKVLRDRLAAQTIEIPRLGNLGDGRPVAIRFEQPAPMEWWATRRGLLVKSEGTLPIIGEPTTNPDALADAELQNDAESEAVQKDWMRAIVCMAVKYIRDCTQNEHGEFIESWQPVVIEPKGKLTDLVDVNGTCHIPIEMLAVWTSLEDIAVAVVKHANFGDNPAVQEVPFRERADDVRSAGE